MNLSEELRRNRAVFERMMQQTAAAGAVPLELARPAGPVGAAAVQTMMLPAPAQPARAIAESAQRTPASRAFSLHYDGEPESVKTTGWELPAGLAFPEAETFRQTGEERPLDSLYDQLEREARLLPQPRSEEA